MYILALQIILLYFVVYNNTINKYSKFFLKVCGVTNKTLLTRNWKIKWTRYIYNGTKQKPHSGSEVAQFIKGRDFNGQTGASNILMLQFHQIKNMDTK